MNVSHIASLVRMLCSIGFDESVGYRLMQRICFKPQEFVLVERIAKGMDSLTCLINFDRKDDVYVCASYEVSLLKYLDMPAIVINSIDLRDLDARMQGVDWNFSASGDAVSFSAATWERETAIEEIVSDLFQLSKTEDGRRFADCLRVKYWPGTAAEKNFGSLDGLRSRFALSQRYYFIDGAGITLDEAHRFLLNKWMEKKMLAKKKDEIAGDEGGGAGVAVEASGLLKKKRISRKKIRP